MQKRPLFLMEYIAISLISGVICFIVVLTALLKYPTAAHVQLNPAPILQSRVITSLRAPAAKKAMLPAPVLVPVTTRHP